MQRKRLTMVLVIFAASVVGLSVMIGTAVGQVKSGSTAKAAKVTTITVTMGKPTEFGFKLSKTSLLPSGPITFKVTNAGVIGHSFKVCTKAVTVSTANSCVGVSTKVLAKGESATLTVTFKAHGKYLFLCTVHGHAAGGMKGLVGVGIKLSAADIKVSVGPTGKGGAVAAGACPSPQTTNITVTMIDFAFQGVPGTIPCGTIIFTTVNAGQEPHNLSVQGQAPGPVIPGGSTATYTVTLGTGLFNYECDVGDHAGQGMLGAFRVT